MKFGKQNRSSHASVLATAVIASTTLAGCHGTNNLTSPPPAALPGLNTITTIGSTLDPIEMGGNPYGLALAPVSAGLITQGDLVVCNFNDGATNTQGKGTTIVGLHPFAGASPYHIAQSSSLLGCSAVTLLPDGSIVATADQANAIPLVSPSGVVTTPYAADTITAPWSDAFVSPTVLHIGGLYVSNASTGAIDRIGLDSNDNQTSFVEIVTGFSVNGGAPGSIAAPAGLTYDPSVDTLYVVDTNQNRIIALHEVSQIGVDGVVVNDAPGDATFSGPSAGRAHVIANGPPLNGPLSGALLGNGNLVVGNTLDPAGTNLLLEVSPVLGVVAMKNVDTGAGGALFGIAAAWDPVRGQLIYFNDDNDNTVKVVSP